MPRALQLRDEIRGPGTYLDGDRTRAGQVSRSGAQVAQSWNAAVLVARLLGPDHQRAGRIDGRTTLARPVQLLERAAVGRVIGIGAMAVTGVRQHTVLDADLVLLHRVVQPGEELRTDEQQQREVPDQTSGART